MGDKYQKIKLSIGLIILGISIFLFLAFNSYWEHGISDQSEIIGEIKNYSKTNNTLGGIGARVSEFVIGLFGLTSYLLVSITSLISIKLLFNIKRLNTLNILIKHTFFILWLPMFFSNFSNKTLSGKLGVESSNEITILMGDIGLILLLIVSLLIFLTITFNINKEKLEKLKKSSVSYLKFISKLIIIKKTIRQQDKKESIIIDDGENNSTNKQTSEGETQITPSKEILKEEKTIVKIADDETTVTENQIKKNKSDDNLGRYQFPELELMKEYTKNKISIDTDEVEANKKLIEDTLKDFKIDVVIKRATVGPTITLYEIIPDDGVRIAKIKSLEKDIALRIKAIGVRIIAPLPGRGTVGIEVPNQNPTIVSMKNVLESEKFQTANLELPIALGKTIANETFVIDLIKMPHLLIAGATGQGKSVGLNVILCSILYKKHPSEVKFILVDCKKVELTLYNKIENHFLAKLPNNNDAIVTNTKGVVKTLNSLCLEMDNRYELLKKAQVRNIQEYNVKYKAKLLTDLDKHRFLPYLILVIDEFADLIMTAGKEIEIPISRLAQLSRAIGIHLIIATQRPTTNIITGTIKANFPTRIAFRVIQGVDSKTILDTVGANQLIGRGDMLISTGSSLLRIQCAFIDTSEVETLTNFIGSQEGYSQPFLLPDIKEEEEREINQSNKEERDPLFKEAALLIILHQQGSTSMIQRKLKLGYNRAGRIVDQLESARVLGPLDGSKGRKVLVQTEEELNQIL